jgi:hypothetical protein
MASLVLVISVCGTTAATLFADQPASKTIAWRMQPDERLRLRMTHRMQTELQVGEKRTAVSMLSAMELHWRVLDVDASGSMQIDQTIHRLILRTTEADGTTSSYDSSAPEAVSAPLREVADALRPLLNSRVTLMLGPRGQILDVRQAAETESLLQDLPEFANGRDLLTRDGLSRMLHQALGRLPDQPVAPGDVWQDARELQTPVGTVALADRFEYRGTVVEEGRQLERIHRTTTIRRGESGAGLFEAPEPQAPPKPQDTGVLDFDNHAGRLRRSQNRHQWKSEASREGGQMVVSITATLETVVEPLDAP